MGNAGRKAKPPFFRSRRRERRCERPRVKRRVERQRLLEERKKNITLFSLSLSSPCQKHNEEAFLPFLRSLKTCCVQKTKAQEKKREKKTLRFHSVEHFGVRVFREQLRFEGFEVRPRFRSVGHFEQHNVAKAGISLDQEVERGVNLGVVLGEMEGLERLQLADKQAGLARRPQRERLSSRRDCIFPSSAGNASPWGAFPRFSLPWMSSFFLQSKARLKKTPRRQRACPSPPS